MVDYEFDVVVDYFVGDCYGLFGIVGVVVDYVFELCVVYVVCFVDLFDCYQCIGVLYVVVLGYWIGDWVSQGDFDGVGGYGVVGEFGNGYCGEQVGQMLSIFFYSVLFFLCVVIVVVLWLWGLEEIG